MMRSMLLASIALGTIVLTGERRIAMAAENCCTPEATAKLAASAGFIDIVGIKLGMSIQQAMGALKNALPKAQLTESRWPDYEQALGIQKNGRDPQKEWLMVVTGTDSSGEQVDIGVTTPPNAPVVHSMGRFVSFSPPLAVENVVAGLRKKYGQETLGPDFRLAGKVPVYDDGMNKTFLWFFDSNGKLLKRDEAERIPRITDCKVVVSSNMNGVAPQLRLPGATAQVVRPMEVGGPPEGNSCKQFVILQANVNTPSGPAGTGITGMTQGMQVVAAHWPLLISATNAMYAFMDQKAKEMADKQMNDAKKAGGPRL
jgi:hypothetical protein